MVQEGGVLSAAGNSGPDDDDEEELWFQEQCMYIENEAAMDALKAQQPAPSAPPAVKAAAPAAAAGGATESPASASKTSTPAPAMAAVAAPAAPAAAQAPAAAVKKRYSPPRNKRVIDVSTTPSPTENVKSESRRWSDDSKASEITEPPGSKSPKADAKPKVELTPEQKGVLRHVMEGKNCYYTGKAGTGKSHLLREIIARAPAGTFITASTGIAAINIGGTTLHSFSGIGLGEGSIEMLKHKAMSGKNSRQNWDAVEVLIVDEVSMLHGSLLTKLEEIARSVKKNERPFGGIQLIFTGDFFQLPPVLRGQRGGAKATDYAFQSEVWPKLFPPGSCFELSMVFRQAENRLVDLLSEVRYAKLSPPSLQLLRELSRELSPPQGIEPTLLFGTNERVDQVNNRRLQELPGPEQTYRATDGGQEPFVTQMRKNCIADDVLRLRVGAQVMLIKNIDSASGLVNGAKGRVEDFFDDQEGGHWPVVVFANGQKRVIEKDEWCIEQQDGGRMVKKATRVQVPLKLGWAITIHKSQGMGIEWLEVKLDDLFEEGQGYVALSRAIKLDGLRVVAFDARRFRVSTQVIAFYEQHIRGHRRLEHDTESSWVSTIAYNWQEGHPKLRDGSADSSADLLLAGLGGGRRGPYDDWNSASSKAAAAKRRRGLLSASEGINVGDWLPDKSKRVRMPLGSGGGPTSAPAKPAPVPLPVTFKQAASHTLTDTPAPAPAPAPARASAPPPPTTARRYEPPPRPAAPVIPPYIPNQLSKPTQPSASSTTTTTYTHAHAQAHAPRPMATQPPPFPPRTHAHAQPQYHPPPQQGQRQQQQRAVANAPPANGNGNADAWASYSQKGRVPDYKAAARGIPQFFQSKPRHGGGGF